MERQTRQREQPALILLGFFGETWKIYVAVFIPLFTYLFARELGRVGGRHWRRAKAIRWVMIRRGAGVDAAPGHPV
jgi:hypothetical protein